MSDKVYLHQLTTYSVQAIVCWLETVFQKTGLAAACKNQNVLLKPNLLVANTPEQATTTHPAIIEAVIQLIKDGGGNPVLADRPAWGSAKKVADAGGISAICKRYQVPIIEFSHYQRKPIKVKKRFKSLCITTELEKYPVILNLAKFKVHDQLGLTLAVKNMFGCVQAQQRALAHFTPVDLATFSQMLVGVYLATKPTFSLIDGITAMERKGPRSGDPTQLGVLLAGTNAIAVDRIASEIVSMPFQLVATLVAAQAMQVPGWDMKHITLIGETLENVKTDNFIFPQQAPINFTLYRSLKMFIRMFLYPQKHI